MERRRKFNRLPKQTGKKSQIYIFEHVKFGSFCWCFWKYKCSTVQVSLAFFRWVALFHLGDRVGESGRFSFFPNPISYGVAPKATAGREARNGKDWDWGLVWSDGCVLGGKGGSEQRKRFLGSSSSWREMDTPGRWAAEEKEKFETGGERGGKSWYSAM